MNPKIRRARFYFCHGQISVRARTAQRPTQAIQSTRKLPPKFARSCFQICLDLREWCDCAKAAECSTVSRFRYDSSRTDAEGLTSLSLHTRRAPRPPDALLLL